MARGRAATSAFKPERHGEGRPAARVLVVWDSLFLGYDGLPVRRNSVGTDGLEVHRTSPAQPSFLTAPDH
jgi:hypothetical protein